MKNPKMLITILASRTAPLEFQKPLAQALYRSPYPKPQTLNPVSGKLPHARSISRKPTCFASDETDQASNVKIESLRELGWKGP